MRDGRVSVPVEEGSIDGTLLSPQRLVPGVLFVHGWGGNQEQDLKLAEQVARLGCLCFTFDLRGHARTEKQRETISREHNLRDLVAAYDFLTGQERVDKDAIAVIGASYGGYLAALLTAERPVQWLTLRVPALYEDSEWDIPKAKLNRKQLNSYRQMFLGVEANRALRACSQFRGHALVVESERDEIVAHPAIASYVGAFRHVRSLSYRVMEGADHELSTSEQQKDYRTIVRSWITEMILKARQGEAS